MDQRRAISALSATRPTRRLGLSFHRRHRDAAAHRLRRSVPEGARSAEADPAEKRVAPVLVPISAQSAARNVQRSSTSPAVFAMSSLTSSALFEQRMCRGCQAQGIASVSSLSGTSE